MNASLYIAYIFLILTSNLAASLPKFLNKNLGHPIADEFSDNESNDKLLQQSAQLLHKWLKSRNEQIVEKIMEVEGNLDQTMNNNQQTNLYKFEAMTNAIGSLQQHLVECKQTQEKLNNHKEEVAKYVTNIRNLNDVVSKIEHKLETNNNTLNSHVVVAQNMFRQMDEKLHHHESQHQDLMVFKAQTTKDVSKLWVQLNQQEMMIGKLMDTSMTWTKKINEMQQKMQQNVESLGKTIDGLKGQFDEQKSKSKRFMDDQTDVLRREMQTHKKRMSRQISLVDVRLSRIVEYLNETVYASNDEAKVELDGVKKSIMATAEELNGVRLEGKSVVEYRKKILDELFIQKQEITKHVVIVSALRKDVDSLISRAKHGASLPSKPKYGKKVKFQIK